MRRLSVSASNLGQLDDACAHVGSSARKETKTETKPDPKMLNGSAHGDHQRLFQQHRSKADLTPSSGHVRFAPEADINRRERHVRFVPILLQKSLMVLANSDSVALIRFAAESGDDGAAQSRPRSAVLLVLS